MRRPLIAGNWKMYTDPNSAGELSSELKAKLGNCDWADIAVFPPYISITTVVSNLKETVIKTGGQNLFWETEGAYTGAISPLMLKNAGCEMVLIGHSERRSYFGLTDEKVLKKTKAAVDAGLYPVVCIGETLEQREAGIAEKIIESQISLGIGEIENISSLTLAYEPVWAIGTGVTASPEQAQEIHKFIRDLVRSKWGDQTADNIRILYGGSVKPDNAPSLWAKEDIDGFLVGGASLKSESFAGIAESIK